MEDDWEKWIELPQRQRVRPSHACRVNITVFACNPEAAREVSGSPASSDHTQNVPESTIPATEPVPSEDAVDQQGRHDNPPHESQHVFRRVSKTIPSNIQESSNEHDHDSTTNQTLKIPVHESMKALSREEQQTLAKIHKNLGHPSAERMNTIMLQQGFSPGMVKAARNFQCAVCIQNS